MKSVLQGKKKHFISLLAECLINLNYSWMWIDFWLEFQLWSEIKWQLNELHSYSPDYGQSLNNSCFLSYLPKAMVDCLIFLVCCEWNGFRSIANPISSIHRHSSSYDWLIWAKDSFQQYNSANQRVELPDCCHWSRWCRNLLSTLFPKDHHLVCLTSALITAATLGRDIICYILLQKAHE